MTKKRSTISHVWIMILSVLCASVPFSALGVVIWLAWAYADLIVEAIPYLAISFLFASFVICITTFYLHFTRKDDDA